METFFMEIDKFCFAIRDTFFYLLFSKKKKNACVLYTSEML